MVSRHDVSRVWVLHSEAPPSVLTLNLIARVMQRGRMKHHAAAADILAP